MDIQKGTQGVSEGFILGMMKDEVVDGMGWVGRCDAGSFWRV